MFGVRFCVVEILRMDCRCSSVRPLLCDVLLIFITEQLLTQICAANIQRVQAICWQSWGTASGVKQIDCAGPRVSYFSFSVPLYCSSISSICICTGAVCQMGCETARNYFSVLQSHQSTVLSAKCTQVISKVGIWEHHGTNLVQHYLATGKVRQVALVHLCLPYVQPHLKCLHCIAHISDYALPSLELKV